jgi:hypothetical protein
MYDIISILGDGSGFVGIQKTNPISALDVNGTITSNNLYVNGTTNTLRPYTLLQLHIPIAQNFPSVVNNVVKLAFTDETTILDGRGIELIKGLHHHFIYGIMKQDKK